MKRKLSKWCKDVKKLMIDRNMDTSDVADAFKWTRQYASSIINGRTYQREAVIKISQFFDLEIPDGNTASRECGKEHNQL